MDNIFHEFNNRNTFVIENFANLVSNETTAGDILEFGVCSGQTIIEIAKINKERKIFGFDHFKGLEKSKFACPPWSRWREGAYRVGDPDHTDWIPKNIEEVIEKISVYQNIQLIIEDIHKLSHPSHYGISKIVAVNIDVDIYEPTASALRFIDQCQWDRLIIRFDDWHGHEPAFDNHERLACREWLTKNSYQFDIPCNGHAGGMIVYRHLS